MQEKTIEAVVVAQAYASQMVAVTNGLIFISGVLPFAKGNEKTLGEDVKEHLELAFENLQSILNEADSDLDHLVSIQILIPNKESMPVINEVYHRMLGEHKPARSIIPCKPLHPNALIEVNAVAMLSPERVNVKWYQSLSEEQYQFVDGSDRLSA